MPSPHPLTKRAADEPGVNVVHQVVPSFRVQCVQGQINRRQVFRWALAMYDSTEHTAKKKNFCLWIN